ncbi:MAG: hypothetical protein OHK0038_09220 [Flammeovirgaceae bacterium]
MNLAPIALFVFNRPEHTLKTLEALADNSLAQESVLYIFADGAKALASSALKQKILEVRKVIRLKKWCKEVHIIERQENWGLAGSVIAGVSKLVNLYGKVIVLEDDVITSKGFLKYMNDALDFYENKEQVMHISGYMMPVSQLLPSTFFLQLATCWGWATWKRAWQHFNPDAQYHYNKLISDNQLNKFNLEGNYEFSKQLIGNINKSINTWAIKWYASIFEKNGLALHPYPSLTQNIGADGSGNSTDARAKRYFWYKLAENIDIQEIEIAESKKARQLVGEFYKKVEQGGTYLKYAWLKRLKNLFPKKLEHWAKYWLIKSYKKQCIDASLKAKWKSNLRRLPDNKPVNVEFLGKMFYVPSGKIFLEEFEAIFEKEILKFNPNTNNPTIVLTNDHLGLKVLYFKTLYPESQIYVLKNSTFILGENSYKFAQKNVETYQLKNVRWIATATPKELFIHKIDYFYFNNEFPLEIFKDWILLSSCIFYQNTKNIEESEIVRELEKYGYNVQYQPHRLIFPYIWQKEDKGFV